MSARAAAGGASALHIPARTRIHFVGVGGIGMSGIAELLLGLGYPVSGSDLGESAATRRLAALGGTIARGHAAEHVRGAQVVVASAAVPAGNVELAEARRLGVPVIPRAEMLAELMRLKRCVAVAGAHGKTTTTSLVAVALAAAGLDPTAVVGGVLDAFGSNARLGQGELLVAEADESDGSFRCLLPTWAVVTNVDREHLDYWGSYERILEGFAEFANKVPFYGAAILGVGDPGVRALLPRVRRRVVTFSLEGPEADVRGVAPELGPSRGSCTVLHRGAEVGRLALPLPGAHNLANALAAVAVGLELGVPAPTLLGALATFRNARRRFEVRGEPRGVLVVDDYAHHPAEIRATLAAARAHGRRIVAAFQPHRFTRTRDLEAEFAAAFGDADLLFVTEIYPASEEPIPGVDGRRLAGLIAGAGKAPVRFVPDVKELPAALAAAAVPGDLVITLGAGSIKEAPGALLALLEARS